MGVFKWLGGILGFTFGGGIFGGIIGYAIGSLLEKKVKTEYRGGEQQGDFIMGLLILTAAVMKADGKVMKSELNFVKDFLAKNFGANNLQNRIDILRQLLDKNIDVYQTCEKIRISFPYATKLQLLHYLFGIAVADNDCTKAEKDLIERIANLIGLSQADYKSIEAMYFRVTDSAYVILQVERNATDEEIKRAYKRMCIKYHPDKVAHLGEEAQKAANEKFQEINNAYEQIKKERNLV
ncbi:MAG: TerB family tellurite resistance protein [Bacteroidales bacterium]|nr:TerB family tellurite resistance protein [Bacteroidales bacterium]MEE0926520.1 TerB family tellurite resistance protein [Bacteroidales bacterium]MEE1189766.1 TerB family tellurite resistance protein [Bacteroidales bacterium]